MVARNRAAILLLQQINKQMKKWYTQPTPSETSNCVTMLSVSFEIPNDVEDRAFIVFNLDLAPALISLVHWINVQPRLTVTPSMFLSMLTKID